MTKESREIFLFLSQSCNSPNVLASSPALCSAVPWEGSWILSELPLADLWVVLCKYKANMSHGLRHSRTLNFTTRNQSFVHILKPFVRLIFGAPNNHLKHPCIIINPAPPCVFTVVSRRPLLNVLNVFNAVSRETAGSVGQRNDQYLNNPAVSFSVYRHNGLQMWSFYCQPCHMSQNAVFFPLLGVKWFLKTGNSGK